MEVKIISELPQTGGKPISREALARCVLSGGIKRDKEDLAARIRVDSSFDVILVNTAATKGMKVGFYRFKGEVPLFRSYCGDALERAIAQLPYGEKGYQFSSAVEI